MTLLTFEQAVENINEQLSRNPIKELTVNEEAEITKLAIQMFETFCGDVPLFYVEEGPHGLVEIVLGVQCL